MNKSVFGFSLIELMVGISITGVLMAFAVPSFTYMLKQNRAMGMTNELVASLNLARSEAVRRNQQVTVCISDVTASNTSCSTSLGWQNGWVAFLDLGTLGVYDSTKDTKLKVGQPSYLNVVITADSIFNKFVSFNAMGIAQGTSGQQSGGNLYVCSGGVSGQTVGVQRTININTIGRISIRNGTC